jgi:hypothetical protein
MMPDHAARLRSVRTGPAVVFTKYSQRINRVPETLFCFLEGPLDHSVYVTHVRTTFSNAKVSPIPCHGKRGVLDIFGRLKSLDANFANAIFFVDRDYDDILNNQAPCDWRIFVTSGYSLESEYVCQDSMLILLRDVIAIAEDEEDITTRVDSYIQNRDAIGKALVPLLAVALFLRSKKCEINFQNVRVNKLVVLQPNSPRVRVKHALNVFLSLCLQKGPAARVWDARTMIRILRQLPFERAVRGKYALEYMRSYIEAILLSLKQSSVKHVSISTTEDNLVQLLSGKKWPTGLASFLDHARPRLSVPL